MNFAKDILSPRALAGVLVIASCAPSALAQDKIDGTRKWSWGENIGWMNWRDAGVHGVRVHDGFLSGRIWSENVGWISLGNGTPAAAGGTRYGNTDGSDYGVNIAANGDLSGLAWGENIGWINLDDSGNFVALRCAADYNDDGISDILDFLDFMDDFAACDGNAMPCGQWGDPDLMPDQFVDILDFLEFMQVFAEGCA